jgi:hypothetical protein
MNAWVRFTKPTKAGCIGNSEALALDLAGMFVAKHHYRQIFLIFLVLACIPPLPLAMPKVGVLEVNLQVHTSVLGMENKASVLELAQQELMLLLSLYACS